MVAMTILRDRYYAMRLVHALAARLHRQRSSQTGRVQANTLLLCSIVQEAPQLTAPARMLQLAQRLGLDLADSFAGDGELLPDFFQRVVGVHADAEAHT